MLFTRGYLDDSTSMVGHVSGPTTGDGPIRYVASTGGPKRDLMDLDPTRWKVDNFHKAGGPVLWHHDQTIPPIGTARCVVDPRRRALLAEVSFDPDDPLAVKIEKKVRKGYLRAISVSWDPCDRNGQSLGMVAGGSRRRPFYGPPPGDVYHDLTELSITPIPMDPDALVTERAMRLLRERGAVDDPTWRDYDDPYSDVTAERLLPGLVPVVLEEFERRGIDLAGAYELSFQRGAMATHMSPKSDEDTPWDADAEVAQADGAEQLKRMHAWMDYDADPDVKETYQFPHHHADGRVNWHALGNAMARLRQADIPDEDLGGVWRHIAGHYRQFDQTPPEFRSHVGSFTRAMEPPPDETPAFPTRAVSDLLTAFSIRGADA